MLGVRSLEHFVTGPGVFIPAAERLQIHGTKLPLAKGVLNTSLETALLLLHSNLEPVFDENNPSIHDVFLELGADLEKLPILFFSAKAHHVLDAGAVVPAPVEDHDFTCGRKMLHVALNIHLGFLAIRWRG